MGATCTGHGVRFRVWAPTKQRVAVWVEHDGRARTHQMEALGDGYFAGETEATAGDLYGYLLDGAGPFADPASRYQPQGVDRLSEIIDANQYVWSDSAWEGVAPSSVVIYELHVGTFTAAGTFVAAIERLPYLRDLGVNTIELMPVGEFPGTRNWGYDVAGLFAPAHCYGRPDDLRRLVDAAHRAGLAVLLDVVYNHFGPDGAPYVTFSPFYLSERHQTPWGPAINLDGVQSAPVRELLVENAEYWLHDFHFDGLRLDATHALIDDGLQHFLAELSHRTRTALHPRPVLLIAEDDRNEARLLRAPPDGYGLDAVWADDLHHQIRRHVVGDREGYFADYSGTSEDIAATVRRSWFYCGQRRPTSNRPRGTDPSGLLPRQFVVCLQNHDQIGNRAFGDRLHRGIDPGVYRALVVLLLALPQTPLLFMGQEWGARTPFLYFTDHREPIGSRVTAGRRRELQSFSEFSKTDRQEAIPDPQRIDTFLRSRLDWSELELPAAAAVHALHRRCLRLRSELPPASEPGWGYSCDVVEPEVLGLLRWSATSVVLIVINLGGASGPIDTETICGASLQSSLRWSLRLHTEKAEFTASPMPPEIDLHALFPTLRFARAGAVVLAADDLASDGLAPSPL